MKTVPKLLCVFWVLFISIFTIVPGVNAQQDTHISENSSIDSIKKVQTIFQKLWLYWGKINGDFTSIQPIVLKLQKELAIIKNENDEKAGIVDNTLLKRTISTYQKTPQRLAKLAEKKVSDLTVRNSEWQEWIQWENEERKFIVTAYYSPLKWQKKYSTGSYWGDIRLNGEWTHWASGSPVYYGFIAAPKNYPFGTKIYLEGFGNGVVEDRGGAIVNAGKRWHEYDRLDIWMWYGDVGLNRALNWGKRTVNWKILWDWAVVIDSFYNSWASEYASLRVTPNSQAEDVKRLQKLLKKLWYYNGSINGTYASVENSLVKYQVKNKIIANAESDGAWYFWPKTFLAVQKELAYKEQSESIWGTSQKIQKKIILPSQNDNSNQNKSQDNDEEKSKEVKAFPLLTLNEKAKLKSLWTQISKNLNAKAQWNRILLEKYEWTIRKKLQLAIENTSSHKWIQKLQYLLRHL